MRAWAAVACLLAGAAQAADAPTTLRFEGSNTVGEELAPGLVRAWAQKLGLGAIRTIEGAPEETELTATGAEQSATLRATIHAHGTGTGLDPLLAGHADLWMASRPATAAETQRAEAVGFGRMAEASNEHTIALDGLLVIVHRDNRVARLTIDQLADIFSGRVTRWSQVGGRDAAIKVLSRDDKSGTYDTFATLVLRGRPLLRTARRFEASEDLSDEVASDPDAIGFIGLAYQRSAKPVSIATSCGLVVEPGAFAVKAGEYPLSRRLYLYTGERPPPNVTRFLSFAQSLDAQAAVAQAGFVDFRPALAEDRYTGQREDHAADALDGGQTTIRETDLQEFEDATRGAVRLSLAFRFIAGSDRLDSLARANLDRIAEIMRAASLRGAKIVLIGFTQSQGDYRLNREVSQRRAKAVAAELEQRGVPVALTTGVGPAAPVACNTDDASRALNQRVEVWLQKPR